MIKLKILFFVIIFYSISFSQNGFPALIDFSFHQSNQFKISHGPNGGFHGTNLNIQFFSLSVATKHSNPDKYYVSINPLFWASSKILRESFTNERSIFYKLGLLFSDVQIIPNIRWEPDILYNKVRFVIGQSTDYFIYDSFHIFTESILGTKFLIGNFCADISFRIPLTRVFLADRSPYFKFGISYVFDYNSISRFIIM